MSKENNSLPMTKNLQIYEKLKNEWGKILGFDLRLADRVKANNFQAHLLHCTALIYGLNVDKGLLRCGLSVDEIIANSTFNDKSNLEFNDFSTENSLSLYFYCDSLGFRRGGQPVHSRFTYPFLTKQLIDSEGSLASTEIFVRGRGGLTFTNLSPIVCTDIGYLGSLRHTIKCNHFDVLIFQLGLVDFVKFNSSKIYKFFCMFGFSELINYLILNFYFIPKIGRLFDLKNLLNNNSIFIFFSIGYCDIKDNILLKKINQLIESKCLENNLIFVNIESMKIDDYLDEGHLTEVGHFKYARYIANTLINRLLINL